MKEIALMKTKLVKSIIAHLVVACALVSVAAAGTPSKGGTQGGRIQGTWETQVTLNDCAGHVIRSFQGMLTFHDGGTLMDGTTTPSALRSPGEGVWRHTTDNTFAFRTKAFNFNAQNVYTGWSIIAGELTVDRTGDAFAGPATVNVYDPNGVLLTTLCADATGTRFEL
jgi:hypothetical protein